MFFFCFLDLLRLYPPPPPPQLQSTCHYTVIENDYVKIWLLRLGRANNMHPLRWRVSEKIPFFNNRLKREFICLKMTELTYQSVLFAFIISVSISAPQPGQGRLLSVSHQDASENSSFLQLFKIFWIFRYMFFILLKHLRPSHRIMGDIELQSS